MAKFDAEAEQEAKIEKWTSLAFKGLGIIVLIILSLILVRYLRFRSPKPELIVQQPASIKKIEEQLEQLERKNTYISEDQKIKHVFNNQPEVAAQIITEWLEDYGGETRG
jgi:flagellar biosynthesis/type III secretory pathway M-ring protein FliF/YscJ